MIIFDWIHIFHKIVTHDKKMTGRAMVGVFAAIPIIASFVLMGLSTFIAN